ncbi:hypothetical protein CIB48_g11753 [Xylaria polymorpha]|nr:hypothetical protein CIB48_g11753 [Xylaria polymorpha]
MHTIIYLLAYAGLFWGCFVLVVQGLGSYKLFRHYSSVPKKPVSPTLPKRDIPHVTIIRPAKGLEPALYECLASAFHQTYPPEDPYLTGEHGHPHNIGPNPKIRNVSRAYREAKGDIVWPLDCNIWIAKDVAGLRPPAPPRRRHGHVHEPRRYRGPGPALHASVTGGTGTGDVGVPSSVLSRSWAHGGGRLEEMFMSTTHAKFYCAINTVGIAPCIVGKSNMFRKSHLDAATDPARNPVLAQTSAVLPTGIDYFSSYMCEDHVIGDLLWRTAIPGFANHGLVDGDLAIQPMAGMSVRAYVARRVRWLRARKWTVLSATLVEHGVESLVCCFYLSFALTTVPWIHETSGIPQTWTTLFRLWVVGVTIWMLVDRAVSKRLHAGLSISVDENTPSFARGASRGGAEKRPFGQWLLAWLGREMLALPIWTWAVFLGTGVNWRGRRFRVRSDMTVVAMDEEDTKDMNGRGPEDRGGKMD